MTEDIQKTKENNGPEPREASKSPDPKAAEQAEQPKKGSITISKAEYERLQKEVAEHKDRYLRLLAEFENTRKRVDREKQEFIKYANEELIIKFLGILDDLERSVEAAKAKHQDYDAFLKGIEMVMAHVYDMLTKNNVRPIEAAGKKFDPNTHEALMQEESEKHEDGTILEEYQKGYKLGDRVVRTAKVKVATAKGARANEDTTSGT